MSQVAYGESHFDDYAASIKLSEELQNMMRYQMKLTFHHRFFNRKNGFKDQEGDQNVETGTYLTITFIVEAFRPQTIFRFGLDGVGFSGLT